MTTEHQPEPNAGDYAAAAREFLIDAYQAHERASDTDAPIGERKVAASDRTQARQLADSHALVSIAMSLAANVSALEKILQPPRMVQMPAPPPGWEAGSVHIQAQPVPMPVPAAPIQQPQYQGPHDPGRRPPEGYEGPPAAWEARSPNAIPVDPRTGEPVQVVPGAAPQDPDMPPHIQACPQCGLGLNVEGRCLGCGWTPS